MDIIHLETYLENKQFTLNQRLGEVKTYHKNITDLQELYITISINSNKILDVEYKHNSSNKFEPDSSIVFETITTINQLIMLIKALENENAD